MPYRTPFVVHFHPSSPWTGRFAVRRLKSTRVKRLMREMTWTPDSLIYRNCRIWKPSKSELQGAMPEPTPLLLFNDESLMDTVREALLVLNVDLRVRRANRSFFRTFNVAPKETEGRLIY